MAPHMRRERQWRSFTALLFTALTAFLKWSFVGVANCKSIGSVLTVLDYPWMISGVYQLRHTRRCLKVRETFPIVYSIFLHEHDLRRHRILTRPKSRQREHK